jgi:hypothetical protein
MRAQQRSATHLQLAVHGAAGLRHGGAEVLQRVHRSSVRCLQGEHPRGSCAQHHVGHVTESAEVVLHFIHRVQVAREALYKHAVRSERDGGALVARHQVAAHAAAQVLQADEEQLRGHDIQAGVQHGDGLAR